MHVAYHAHYLVWFEIGRTEFCRADGISYRELEASGVFLAVVDLRVRYRSPARYDDELHPETTLTGVGRVRLDHEYRLLRDGLILATGATTLACLDTAGRLRPLPDTLFTNAVPRTP